MKIKKSDIANLLLFLIGIFCQINQLMPKKYLMVYLGFCFFLFILSVDFKRLKLRLGFLWYLLFVMFVLFSLTYTINSINPNYVYIRIITYLFILFLLMPVLDNKEKFNYLFKGLLIGGLIGITVVLINQRYLIGVRRLGTGIYGSYAEFGAVCSGTMASFIILHKSFNNKALKIILFIYIAVAVMLSGARKAMLISISLPLLIQLFDKRKVASKKIILLLSLSILSVLIVYFSINNTYLYKFIGNRIESGITSIVGQGNEDASLYERNMFKSLAKEVYKENPILGSGIHGFAYKNYVRNGLLVYSHDGFLEILSCYGLLGFVIYYWIFAYIFINYKKMLYDEVGIFLFSYTITILLMELYSISFLNSYSIIMIAISANMVSKRRKKYEIINKEDIKSFA